MAKKKPIKKAPLTERSSSFIGSRVDREAAEGKQETKNTVIRAKVDGGGTVAGSPTATRKAPKVARPRSTKRARKSTTS